MAKYKFDVVKAAAREHVSTVMKALYGSFYAKDGAAWLSSPLSTNGKSCRVELSGVAAGTWKDFSPAEHPVTHEVMSHGDVVDLVRLKNQMSYADACEFIGDLLRLEKSYVPVKLDSIVYHRSLTAGSKYFTDSGIPLETIEACKSLVLAETDESQYIAFLHKDINGNITAAHLLYPRQSAEESNQWIWHGKPVYPWRIMEALEGDRKLLIVTEGEKDALALVSLGYNAISIPSGASNTRWITVSSEMLQIFDEVCVFFDNDEAGQQGAKRAYLELMGYNVPTSFVRWGDDPCKDAADMLKDGREETLRDMINNRLRLSLDFSVLSLQDKPDYAIVHIDGKQYSVSALKNLLKTLEGN